MYDIHAVLTTSIANPASFVVTESVFLGSKLTVGVVSPYNAQVRAIQEKIGKTYDMYDGFSVKVKSVDGFKVRRRMSSSYLLSEVTELVQLGFSQTCSGQMWL